MKLIDSHCHVHDQEFFRDQTQAVYERAIDADIGMITIATSEADSQQALKFVENRQNIWATIGVHPHSQKINVEKLKEILDSNNPKIVAIGETGLDYHYDNSPRETQQHLFESQLQLALDYDLPVSFHVREAFDDFWPIVDNFPKVRGVLHSFTDNWANAQKGLERGFYIGINGIATFTKDAEQLKVYKEAPLDKILLETDAPFLTPKPFRGKMNEVKYVELVAGWCAKSRTLPFDEIARVTYQNTCELFKI